LREVRASVPGTPLYVGSGATPDTLPDLLWVADGAIVGTAAKVEGKLDNPVDPGLARAIVVAAREVIGR
jgi:predicted TIM-barrel enzyme